MHKTLCSYSSYLNHHKIVRHESTHNILDLTYKTWNNNRPSNQKITSQIHNMYNYSIPKINNSL